jgi:hypothetical protein
LTLELMKPRRIANVQLLGTVEQDPDHWLFNPGITILPTLDTPAEIGAPETLKAIFETPPRRNKPEGYEGEDFDCDLRLGCPTGHRCRHPTLREGEVGRQPVRPTVAWLLRVSKEIQRSQPPSLNPCVLCTTGSVHAGLTHGLSRMTGNCQVRFLGEGAAAMPFPYPTR